MKISGIKYYKDNNSFNLLKRFGVEIKDIENMEEVDKKIEELVNSNYKTILITGELAGFSQDIVKKYNKEEKINIIITKNKNNRNE